MFFNKFKTVNYPNQQWNELFKSGTLTLKSRRIFNPEQRFFTIGSCFAEEIRKALTARGIVCYPEYRKIRIDPQRVKIDTLPQREHMNFYNSYSVLQEIKRAAGLWNQDPEDIWEVPKRDIQDGRFVGGDQTLYQDPYRRLVFGRTREDLLDALKQINAVFKEGLLNADVCVITLGTIEVFKKRNNGLVCNQVPVYGGGSGLRETKLYVSDYQENLENTRATLELLKAINPGIQVVLTVSPVPLHQSFNENDIFVSNFESKCTLRAVVTKVCREFDWAYYFPAFEMVWGTGVTAYDTKDRLHVKEEFVTRIVDAFIDSHFVVPDPAAPAG